MFIFRRADTKRARAVVAYEGLFGIDQKVAYDFHLERQRLEDVSMVTPTLVWPGFSPDALQGGARVRRRLARAEVTAHESHGLLGLVARALDMAAVPAAALSRLAAGEQARPGEYLAEPVMLSPDRDRLLLRRLGGEGLARAESDALIEAAHRHFPREELLIERDGDRWFAQLPGSRACAGFTAGEADGMLLAPMPEQFGISLAGMRVLNELQMLWFKHPVNETRRRAGRPEANTLWVWGGGGLPPGPATVEGLSSIVSSDPVLAALADWLGLGHKGPEAALGQGDPRGGLFIVGVGEDNLGLRWLERLSARRPPYRLLASGREWQVPARHWAWRW